MHLELSGLVVRRSLSSGGSLRLRDFLSIRRAMPMGKLQAFVMLLGIGFSDCLVEPGCFDVLFLLPVVVTRGVNNHI